MSLASVSVRGGHSFKTDDYVDTEDEEKTSAVPRHNRGADAQIETGQKIFPYDSRRS